MQTQTKTKKETKMKTKTEAYVIPTETGLIWVPETYEDLELAEPSTLEDVVLVD